VVNKKLFQFNRVKVTNVSFITNLNGNNLLKIVLYPLKPSE
jgi:hypothetical protein